MKGLEKGDENVGIILPNRQNTPINISVANEILGDSKPWPKPGLATSKGRGGKSILIAAVFRKIITCSMGNDF